MGILFHFFKQTLFLLFHNVRVQTSRPKAIFPPVISENGIKEPGQAYIISYALGFGELIFICFSVGTYHGQVNKSKSSLSEEMVLFPDYITFMNS